jgi:O-antigen/teichoic acid export membrane protein
VLVAFGCNLAFVVVTTGALLLMGNRILHAWAGAAIAQGAAPVMTTVVWSSALLGLNVTATYALLALGRVRIVTFFNLAGGTLMLLMMLYLAPRMGVRGIAFARLSYAIVPLCLYIPLLRILFKWPASRRTASVLQPVGEQ